VVGTSDSDKVLSSDYQSAEVADAVDQHSALNCRCIASFRIQERLETASPNLFWACHARRR